jgi:dihydroflavonol-4-reductase
MRALVTGASGFVGSHLVRALLHLQKPYKVRALVRPTSRLKALEGLDVEVVRGDVRDPDSIRRAVAGCALVFHCAALYAFNVRPQTLIYDVNVEGTRNVLQAAWDARVERVVHTSSVAALGGTLDEAPLDERVEEPRILVGAYSRSKYLGERVARGFAERGLPVVIVNPAMPVGPYDTKPTPSGRLIVDFLNGRMPAYVDTRLNVVDVEAVALGHLLAAEKGRPGERYLLGGENLTLEQLLGKLSKITGRPKPRVKLPYGLLLPLAALGTLLGSSRLNLESLRMARFHPYVSSEKAVRELGFSLKPIDEALRRAVRWFRENGYVRD